MDFWQGTCAQISKRIAKGLANGEDDSDGSEGVKPLMIKVVLVGPSDRQDDVPDPTPNTETQKPKFNTAAASIPPGEVSDQLIRYEAHLSREFDRTLSQLERLQRMRKGQPVLPPIKVELSS